MPSKSEPFEAITTVVADTGVPSAVEGFRPADGTKAPGLVPKAAQNPAGDEIITDDVPWGQRHDRSAAVPCADAGIWLISPVLGRIMDSHAERDGRTHSGEDAPRVRSIRSICACGEAHGIRPFAKDPHILRELVARQVEGTTSAMRARSPSRLRTGPRPCPAKTIGETP